MIIAALLVVGGFWVTGYITTEAAAALAVALILIGLIEEILR